MQRMLFGKKSEKMVSQVPADDGEQMSMFNEAEQDADPEVPDPLAVEEIEVTAHKRKKNSRKELFPYQRQAIRKWDPDRARADTVPFTRQGPATSPQTNC